MASELGFLLFVLLGALPPCPAAKVPATKQATNATRTCHVRLSNLELHEFQWS
jgi:hypothetical protein